MSEDKKEYYFSYIIKGNLLLISIGYPDDDYITKERTHFLKLSEIDILDLDIDEKGKGHSLSVNNRNESVIVSGDEKKVTKFYSDVINASMQLYSPGFMMVDL